MAVAVFDADVLIAYLSKDDAHHLDAVEVMRGALAPGTRRLISAVNYAEILIGPLRRVGPAGVTAVDEMVGELGIEFVSVDRTLARRAAAVRVRTGLKLPDAYALATAIDAETRVRTGVRLETFDTRVRKAYEALHPLPPDVG